MEMSGSDKEKLIDYSELLPSGNGFYAIEYKVILLILELISKAPDVTIW